MRMYEQRNQSDSKNMVMVMCAHDKMVPIGDLKPNPRNPYRHPKKQAASKLKNNRFAVWVVGDYRDKATGNYVGFIGETVRAFQKAGMSLYNEAAYITPIGSLALRVSANFETGRKLGKAHQNVLVFIKGDWREAAKACGPCEVGVTEIEDDGSDINDGSDAEDAQSADGSVYA